MAGDAQWWQVLAGPAVGGVIAALASAGSVLCVCCICAVVYRRRYREARVETRQEGEMSDLVSVHLQTSLAGP